MIRRLRRPLLAVAAASAAVLSIGVMQTPALAGPPVAAAAGDRSTVIPKVQPSKRFSISANPSSLTVTAGQSATATISTTLISGRPQTINLSASGLPLGATVSFNPPSVTTGGSSTLTISTSTSTPASTSTVIVTGASGSATRTTTITLTVDNPSGGGLTLVSTDPYTNTSSQHATEVEPDTFSNGSMIVSSAQVGRFTDGGASNASWNTSTDGGASWQHGMLPGITVFQGGVWARVSDPSVAYDARHGMWMIAGLVLNSSVNGAGVTVSRSTDGITWQNPVLAVGNDGQGYDKEWIVCDNTAGSPFYGNCYIEVDITSGGNRIVMIRSTDGGATWSAPVSPSGTPSGLAGQPLVQPNGTVVVPYSANGASIRSFTSTNGGSSWNATVLISNVSSHPVAGGLRDGEGLPSAEIDANGTIYVAWQDCRFRSGCPANDIVFSTSTNGTTWSAVTRVPIDATTSTVDHFIPGIGVDKATSGTSAKVGLYYYSYPNAACTSSTCQLQVGFISSADGGATWSAPHTLAGPFPLSQIAATTQGRMVGDYISCSVTGGNAVAIFAVGRAPGGGLAFDEAMYTAGGLAITGGTARAEQDTGPALAPQAERTHLSTL